MSFHAIKHSECPTCTCTDQIPSGYGPHTPVAVRSDTVSVSHIPQSVVQKIEDRALAFHTLSLAIFVDSMRDDIDSALRLMNEMADRFERRHDAASPPHKSRNK